MRASVGVTMILPDTDGAMRSWMRSAVEITSIVAQRIYFKLPQQDSPIYPLLTFYRVAGFPDEHGQDYPDYIFECWGVNKHGAGRLALALAGLVTDQDTYRPNLIFDGARIKSGRVNAGPYEISGTNAAKRYRLDATFHMCAV